MTRSTWTLIAILVLLIGAAYIVLQRPGEHASTDTSGVLVSFDSAAVDRIELHSASGPVILHKDNGAWIIDTPIHFGADQSVVGSLIANARSIPVKNVVSSNPSRHALFKVDSTGTAVHLYAGNSLLAAFYVGKPSSSFSETYVRKEGSNDVDLADGMFGYMYSRSPNEWRDKTILGLKEGEIQTVRFTYGDTTFTVSRADSGWTVDGQKAGGAVDRVMAALDSFFADGFIDTAFTPAPTPSATLTVNGIDLRFYKQASNYAVQNSLSPQWYTVNDWKVQGVLKRKNELLPTTVSEAK